MGAKTAPTKNMGTNRRMLAINNDDWAASNASSKTSRNSGGMLLLVPGSRPMNCACSGPIQKAMGMSTMVKTHAPIIPDRNPTIAPSAAVIGKGWSCCMTYAARYPPLTIHKQQQLANLTNGNADRTPMNNPPSSAGMSFGGGIQEWLSFYFKSPMHAPGLYPEHDLFIQLMKLKNTLRYLKGEELITHLGSEYYDW